jgi:hypothetical protein
MFESMKDYANAENAIFTGTAGLLQDRGVPVEVDRWLWGEGAAPVVWLSANSFGDEAGCGTSPPTPDTQWIWVTWLPGNGGDFGTGLCSPAGMLGTDQGDAMLHEAVAVFGGLSPTTPTSAPTEAAPVADSPEPVDPAAAARDTAGLVVGAGVALASLGLFGALILIARRQGDRTA